MKRRIFIGTAVIAVLMTFLVGYLATVRINNASEHAIQQNLLTNAKIIAAEQDEASMRHAADLVAEASGMNVTLILKDGTVWYRRPALASGSPEQNHLEREEVKQAFETGVGIAQRHSATMDRTMSYVAVATAHEHPGRRYPGGKPPNGMGNLFPAHRMLGRAAGAVLADDDGDRIAYQ